jgi:hypothetical protein
MKRITAILICLATTGCAGTWRPLAETTLRADNEQVYERLLIVTRDGCEREVLSAHIQTDSIVGMRSTPPAGERLAIANADVVRAEVREHTTAPVLEAVGEFITSTGQQFFLLLRCAASAGRFC